MCLIFKKKHFSHIDCNLHDSSSVQPLSRVQLFATPWTATCQTSLSITNSLLKLMSIPSVMPSNHLILRHLLLLPLSIFPSIKAFPNESVLCIRWPKYWSFTFSISPCNEYPGLISFTTPQIVRKQSPCFVHYRILVPKSGLRKYL